MRRRPRAGGAGCVQEATAVRRRATGSSGARRRPGLHGPDPARVEPGHLRRPADPARRPDPAQAAHGGRPPRGHAPGSADRARARLRRSRPRALPQRRGRDRGRGARHREVRGPHRHALRPGLPDRPPVRERRPGRRHDRARGQRPQGRLAGHLQPPPERHRRPRRTARPCSTASGSTSNRATPAASQVLSARAGRRAARG